MALPIPSFDDFTQWEVIPDVPVFDEHTEKNPKTGKVLARFDKPRLEKIAEICNRRDAQGNLCPLTLGHTLDDAPESEQPDIVGYARKFRVSWDNLLKRYVIRANYYVRRSAFAEAKKYPRTSVELWPEDEFFDPIALIKKTPKRDLGQWIYRKRTGKTVLRYAMSDSVIEDPAQGGSSGMPTPSSPSTSGDHDDPKPGKFARKFSKHISQHFAKDAVYQYAKKCYEAASAAGSSSDNQADSGMPSGSDTFLPSRDETPAKHSKTGKPDKAKLAADQKAIEGNAVEERLVKLEEENTELRRYARRKEREADLKQLVYQGYKLDLVEELEDVQDLDSAKYDKHLGKIKTRYSKGAPREGAPEIRLADNGHEGGENPADQPASREENAAAVKLMTSKGWGADKYQKALGQVRSLRMTK
jgi:flagellar motility protein MotE (MotC chaperone)